MENSIVLVITVLERLECPKTLSLDENSLSIKVLSRFLALKERNNILSSESISLTQVHKRTSLSSLKA